MTRALRNLLTSAAALALSAGTVYAQSVADLAWIAGCWGADGRETGSGEYWVLTGDDELLGVARLVEGGATVSYEFMRISRAGGRVVLTMRPSCDDERSLMLVDLDERSATFENVEDAFPRRITYRRPQADRLVAVIDEPTEGLPRSVALAMTGQRCEVLAARPGRFASP